MGSLGGRWGQCLETDLPTTKATEQARQSPEPTGPPGGTRRYTQPARPGPGDPFLLPPSLTPWPLTCQRRLGTEMETLKGNI